MNAIDQALADVQRMHTAAAFAVKQAAMSPEAASVIGGGELGSLGQSRPMTGNAHEQLLHFTGWVYAAIRPIAQRIAGSPIHVGRATSRRVPGRKAHQLREQLPSCYKAMGDQLEPLDGHPLLDALSDPNSLMVAWSLMYVTVVSLELTGQAFLWVPDDRTILPIPPNWISGHEGRASYEVWKVQPPGFAEPQDIDASEMVYFHYPHPRDPRAVFSPLQAAAQAVETDESIQDCQRRAFSQGISPKVVVRAGRLDDSMGGKMRPVLTPQQRNQLVTAIKSAYSGYMQSNNPIILDGLIEDIMPFSRTIQEMDFLDSGAQTKSRVFQVFGTNPIIAGEIENANRAQATVAEEQFCSGTVNPKIELMSQTLTAWLGPMFARAGERLIVWIEPCRAHDPDRRLKEWSVGLARGIVTPNEYRRNILNLSDIPGGDEPIAPHRTQATPPAAKALDPYTLQPQTNGNGNGRWHGRE